MEKLEKILQNKRNRIIIISTVIIIILGGIYLYKREKQENEEIFGTIEGIEDETEKKENDKEQENRVQNEKENKILKNETINKNEIEDEENELERMNEEKIAIHITGEVKKTGIIYLEEGARIIDAIEAAGGATKNANLNQVNLAYRLEDGQKIYIPNKKEKIEEGAYIITDSGENVIMEKGKSDKGQQSTASKNKTGTQKNTKGGNEKVSINTANQTELESLPGIGPSLAQRIIEYRESNGKFKKIEEIQNVKGIGDSKYRNIKEKISI